MLSRDISLQPLACFLSLSTRSHVGLVEVDQPDVSVMKPCRSPTALSLSLSVASSGFEDDLEVDRDEQGMPHGSSSARTGSISFVTPCACQMSKLCSAARATKRRSEADCIASGTACQAHCCQPLCHQPLRNNTCATTPLLFFSSFLLLPCHLL